MSPKCPGLRIGRLSGIPKSGAGSSSAPPTILAARSPLPSADWVANWPQAPAADHATVGDLPTLRARLPAVTHAHRTTCPFLKAKKVFQVPKIGKAAHRACIPPSRRIRRKDTDDMRSH